MHMFHRVLVFLALCTVSTESFFVSSVSWHSRSTGVSGARRPRWCKPVATNATPSTGPSSLCEMTAGEVEEKLKQLGITLPDVAAAGNYVLFKRSANTVYLSGHLPKAPDGTLTTGKVGGDLDVEQAAEAARLVAVNLITTMKGAAGDLDKIRLIKITGFVHSTDDFTSQSQVLNGASDLFLEVFGREKGCHARSAVGVNALPLGVCVEIEAIVEVES